MGFGGGQCGHDVAIDPLGMDLTFRPRAGGFGGVGVAVDLIRVPTEARSVGLGEGERDRPGLPLDVGILPRDRFRMPPFDGPAVGPEERHDGGPHLAGEVGIGLGGERWIDREALTKLFAPGGRGGREGLDRGPGLLRIDVVGGERRDAAPVVDPGVEQADLLVRVAEVGRRLQVHARPEHHARGGDGRQEGLVIRLGRRLHRGSRLGSEVLDDDLLDVAVPPVRVADREERLGSLAIGLADAHQDAGGERHGEPSRVLDRAQPHRRHLVRRPEVGTPAFGQAHRARLEHHAHRGAHLLQAGDLLVGHHAGVEVGQQAGLLDHPDRDRAHVVQRGRVSTRFEPLAGDVVAFLRPVAQGEQRFLAAHPAAGVGDRDRLFRCQEGGVELGGRLRERAVVAVVAAQHGERDEHLARIGDDLAVLQVAQAGREPHEAIEFLAPGGHQRRGLVEGERLAGIGSGERPADPPRSVGAGHLGHVREPTTLCSV